MAIDVAAIASSPAAFRRALLIDADGKTKAFKPDEWQETDFAALDAAWLAIAGRGSGAAVRRAWIERPRGHSKTADLAIAVTWALTFAVRPIKGIAAAGDKDQAKLLRDAIATLVRLNPWLQPILDVQTWAVANRKTGSTLNIISSDAATSYGQLPDFVVVDELGHWPEGNGEKLWASLFSTAAKRASCLLAVISNAGYAESWVWRVREAVRGDPAWYFHHLDGPQASWISAATLEEQRRILPPLVFDRLWLNVWSSGSGDAIAETDLDAAVTLAGPATGRELGMSYFGGIDLSVSRDHSALVLIGRHYTGRIRVVSVRSWVPPKGGKVDLGIVQAAIMEMHYRFAPKFCLDPYQAELLAQQLTRAGVWVQTVPFVGSALVQMASLLVEVFASRRIDLFPDAALMADLRRLRIKDSPSGWRLDAPRTATGGHCDRAIALALALLGAGRAALQPGYNPAAAGPCILVPGRGAPAHGARTGACGGTEPEDQAGPFW
jgi:hypothetical protein